MLPLTVEEIRELLRRLEWQPVSGDEGGVVVRLERRFSPDPTIRTLQAKLQLLLKQIEQAHKGGTA